jgi:hypothetical protein
MATRFMLESYTPAYYPAQMKIRQPKVRLAERAVFSWWSEANARNARIEFQIFICMVKGLAAGIKMF